MIVQKSTVLPVLRGRSSHRSGFTLTELAIVLGIISIILGAIWISAGQVNEKARITQAMSQFGAVTQNMTSMFQGGYGVSNPPCAPPCNITTNMITAKVIPQWLGTGATASTPWNSGGFYMGWISNSPLTYRISFYNITHDGCLGLIMQATNCTPGQPGCPVTVSSGGTQPVSPAYAGPTYCVALTTSPASAACAVQAPGTAMTSGMAETICKANVYTGAAPNSVEFDFTQ